MDKSAGCKSFRITGGRGADIVINTVASDSATRDLKRLAFGGHLACVAGLPDFSRIEPFTRAVSIHESALIRLSQRYVTGKIVARLIEC